MLVFRAEELCPIPYWYFGPVAPAGSQLGDIPLAPMNCAIGGRLALVNAAESLTRRKPLNGCPAGAVRVTGTVVPGAIAAAFAQAGSCGPQEAELVRRWD